MITVVVMVVLTITQLLLIVTTIAQARLIDKAIAVAKDWEQTCAKWEKNCNDWMAVAIDLEKTAKACAKTRDEAIEALQSQFRQ